MNQNFLIFPITVSFRWFLVFIFFFSIHFVEGQNSNLGNKIDSTYLKKLRKAELKDLDPSTPIMLNPAETPIFTDKLILISEQDFMTFMASGAYIPEPYINDQREVKAFVLRLATEQEKSKMIEMKSDLLESKDSELLGKKAPSFEIKDIHGTSYSSQKLKGKIVVLNFWFVECKPCVMEIPELNKLVAKYENKDVVFIGLSTNHLNKIKSFISNTPFNYHLIPESMPVVQAYQVNSFPTHIIIDKKSKIAWRATGLGANTLSDLDQMLQTLTQ
jgi:peroxiredoxin